MHRDMDLARAILIALEASDNVSEPKQFHIENCTDQQISYHVKLLQEAGLVEARRLSAMNALIVWPVSLTWSGHEFLDAARDDTRWTKAKKIISDKGGPMVFDVIKEVLLGLVRQSVFPHA